MKPVPAETVMDALAQIVQHAGALNALQRFAATGEYRALHDIKTAMVEAERTDARRIGTTRFGCGCTVHVEPDPNGITPWLEHCARHGAPALDVPAAWRLHVATMSALSYMRITSKKAGEAHLSALHEATAMLLDLARVLGVDPEMISAHAERGSIVIRAAVAKKLAHDPLMCREPERCAGRGSCPRDPACNE